MSTPLKITRDSGANVKLLRQLEIEGYIEIYDVLIENGRENKKVRNKVLPVGVWNHTRWDEAVWGGDSRPYSDVRASIGNEHIGDAIQLEAHIRMGSTIL